MPVVANYEFFQDTSFQLPTSGGDIDRTLESNIQNVPVGGERAILMWKHWRTGSGSVTYRVRVNGEDVSNPTISQTVPERDFTTLHETIGAGQIQEGNNRVEFRVMDGTGTVRIADVVILYRHNV